MRTITIVVEERVAEWARVHAARHHTSVSRIVGEMLREQMERELGYDAAMADFFSRGPAPLKGAEDKYPTRDELHAR